jgi:hypothetical protein
MKLASVLRLAFPSSLSAPRKKANTGVGVRVAANKRLVATGKLFRLTHESIARGGKKNRKRVQKWIEKRLQLSGL